MASSLDAPAVTNRSFRDIYNLGADFPIDGRQFAIHTPRQTPAHMSWQVEDAVFVRDTLFGRDYGTARCDFPGESADQLYDSIQRIDALPLLQP
jgi:glyoxylase-like metal-dependent hydrolase (beta-lactamase superfamily II)